ncbi:MAG: Ig-like domain-containing protein, partial [Bacteroidota bacterium]
MLVKKTALLALLLIYAVACSNETTEIPSLNLVEASAGSVSLSLAEEITEEVPIDRSISLTFSSPVNATSATEALSLRSNAEINFDLSFSNENRTVVLFPVGALESGTEYTLQISSQLFGTLGETFDGTQIRFKTVLGNLEIVSATIDGEEIPATGRIIDVPLNLSITLNFSEPISEALLSETISL